MKTNPLSLPQAVADYFANEPTDEAALARCFTEDAVVIDERAEHRGLAAIARWKRESSARYRFTVEVRSTSGTGDAPTVVGKVSGNFPGSPIDLRYRFTLADARIARLEIGV